MNADNKIVTLPLRIFIVDDEQPARNRLRDLLSDCEAQIPLEIIGEADNGMDALRQLSHVPVDVVLLDIRMPGMNGVEVAQHLRAMSQPPVVIFTTAYDAYAIQAFDLHAVDYLLKPIRLRRLFEALMRARDAVPARTEALQELLPEARQQLSIHERGRVYLVPVDKVMFLRAEAKYVTVHTADREYLIEESLTALEKEFAARFVRIHRNCLVARNAISSFERQMGKEESGWAVRLRGYESLLPVSRRQQHLVKEMPLTMG